ncbi:MAG: hypothetical protein LBH76_00210, partial [Propionibacteriaceae bacterium]|nr:hypothetical protein [Propionibacteriaceae bacterium]
MGRKPAPPNVWLVGWAALSCVGQDAEQCFQQLCAGHTGLAPLRRLDPSRFACRQAYELPVATAEQDSRRAPDLALRAIAAAVADAGLTPDDLAGCPIFVGTGLGQSRAFETAALAHASGAAEPPDCPASLTEPIQTAWPACPVQTLSNACAASLYALALAQDWLTASAARYAVVVGADIVSASMFGALERVQAQPPEEVKPFDETRQGVILGEGAAAVVISTALPRRPPSAARPRLAGVGLTCDAYHATAPLADQIEACMRQAHARAQIGPSDIDVVYAHGTGTILN